MIVKQLLQLYFTCSDINEEHKGNKNIVTIPHIKLIYLQLKLSFQTVNMLLL